MPKIIKANLIKEETVSLLKKFQILKALTIDEIRQLLGTKEGDYQKRIAKLTQYQAQEIVIREGDFDSWIFWIVKGAFAVTKNNIVIAEFKEAGEVFGEMSSLEIDSRSASVISTEESICLSIDMSVLDTLSNESIRHKIKNGIHFLQSQRLNATTTKLVLERQKLIEQQEMINLEKKRLIEKEKELLAWEKELLERENK